MANNSYPQAIVESTIKNTINNIQNQTDQENSKQEKIEFYFQLQNLETFKQDEKCLKSIISDHIKAKDNKTVSLRAYYKPYKLGSMFSTRPQKSVASTVNVVYQFKCPEDSCNATYIGYTTKTVYARARQHTYHPSSIHRHLIESHGPSELPSIQDMNKNFEILHRYPDKKSLELAEAILIKKLKPYINIQFSAVNHQMLSLF